MAQGSSQGRTRARKSPPHRVAVIVDEGTNPFEVGVATELGAMFERWETSVAESEVASGCLTASLDDFEEGFVDAEEEAALKLELRALKEDE